VEAIEESSNSPLRGAPAEAEKVWVDILTAQRGGADAEEPRAGEQLFQAL